MKNVLRNYEYLVKHYKFFFRNNEHFVRNYEKFVRNSEQNFKDKTFVRYTYAAYNFRFCS